MLGAVAEGFESWERAPNERGTLSEALDSGESPTVDVRALDGALDRLAAVDEQAARAWLPRAWLHGELG